MKNIKTKSMLWMPGFIREAVWYLILWTHLGQHSINIEVRYSALLIRGQVCTHNAHPHAHTGTEKWSMWSASVFMSCTDQSNSLGCCQMMRTNHKALWVPNNALAQIIHPSPSPLYSQPHPTPQRRRGLVTHPLIVLQPEAMIHTRITSTAMGGSNWD